MSRDSETKGSARPGLTALIAVSALLGAAAMAPASASADPSMPAFDGLLDFPTIGAPADPEEFSWEVHLEAGEHLEAVDDQTAVVRFEDGTSIETISAAPAHDATGSAVPTSLVVAGSNVVTLIVHHRAGNPAAAGASFVYPISYGEAYEAGNSTVTVVVPKDEERLREERELAEGEREASAAQGCRVPRLTGRTVKGSRERLARAGCSLGKVRGERSKAARVAVQFRRPGETLAPGGRVAVRLGG
jgi:hypothetical protein